MDHYNNQQSVSEYEYGLPKSTGGPFVMPPPPVGYPTRDSQTEGADRPIETRSRGDGFWKGCCAAICCCCAIDICF